MLNIKYSQNKWWLNASLALTAAAMLTTSCSKEDDTTLPINEVQPNTPASVEQPEQLVNAEQTYSVKIPATIAGESLSKAININGTSATGTFQASENIYVYNATKATMLYGALQPTEISDDGKQCTLAGDLTGTIEDGDELTLLYNLSTYYSSSPSSCYFDYDSQTGSEADLIDGGIAEGIKATYSFGELTCESAVVFDLTQSVFRFKFQDDDGNAINVKNLLIESSAFAAYYRPLKESSKYSGYQVTVKPAAATNDYLYVSLCIEEEYKYRAFEFTVTDDNDNLYKGTKNAPSSGFANGKFYYNSSAISLTKQATLVKPTIEWTSVENGQSTEPNEYNSYTIWGPWVDNHYTPSAITISGTSIGYDFNMQWGSTITLNGLTAIGDDDTYIYSTRDLNLIVNGANTITCDKSQTIFVDGTLKISGDGTLTVNVNSSGRNGLCANNYSDGTQGDPSVLAAEGYTVTRSEMTNNGDGTYTWTYTVKPE